MCAAALAAAAADVLPPDADLGPRARTRALPASRPAATAAWYLGSRLEPVAADPRPSGPAATDPEAPKIYYRMILGFRLALSARCYLFVGAGVVLPDAALEPWWTQPSRMTAQQVQNALAMQTEYGLGWEF